MKILITKEEAITVWKDKNKDTLKLMPTAIIEIEITTTSAGNYTPPLYIPTAAPTLINTNNTNSIIAPEEYVKCCNSACKNTAAVKQKKCYCGFYN